MKYCTRCKGLRYSDEVAKCRACDNLLVHAPSIADLPEDITFALANLSCDKPSCSALVAPPNARFCANCGVELKPISYELWINKFVNPALETRLAELVLDPSDLFTPISQLGLARSKATSLLDSLLKEYTGVERPVLDRWIEKTVCLLKDVSPREAAIQNAIEEAQKSEIALLHATAIVQLLNQRIEPPPASSESRCEDSLDPISEARDSESLKRSAKSFYRRLVSGDSVTKDLTYLDLKKSVSEDGKKTTVFLREASAQGAFVLFVSDEKHAWIFPNPKLSFNGDSLKPLFADLTADLFDNFKSHIEPVPVVRVGKDRWEVRIARKPSRKGQNNGNAPAPPEISKLPKQPVTFPEPKVEKIEHDEADPEVDIPLPRPEWHLRLVIGIVASLVLGTALLLSISNTSNPPVRTPNPIPTPSVPINMVRVPGGEYLMGTNDGDEFERPAHKVIVKPFLIDAYEVTCEEYQKFVRATGHRVPSNWKGEQYPRGAAKRPVTGVDWDDATAYARWARKRLPTEEEWEFAARGSDGRRYPWGNDWQDVANANGAFRGLIDVGFYKDGASFVKAYDMIGNAWEWTASPLVAYPGGRLPSPVTGEQFMVLRGGSWQSNKSVATTTYRFGWPARGKKNEYRNTGFRCAQDIAPEPRK